MNGAEGQIRKRLIEKNHIDAIIGLPANIFFGTGIPTLVMVLKQHRDNDDILIIDASKGFVKDNKQNKLRASDIKRIADAWCNRADIPGFSRKVSREEIRQNDYNLNIPRYVDSSEAPEQYDIYATMNGGIPNSEIAQMQQYWDVFPKFYQTIFKPEEGKPYSQLTSEDLGEVAVQSEDIHNFKMDYCAAFDDFYDKMKDVLIDHLDEVKEMKAHDELSDDIFCRIENTPLVDRYAIYQILSDQWPTIVNDIEIIQTEGLDAVRTVEPKYKIVKDGDEDKEVEDGLKGRILPFELVQQVRLKDELLAINEKLSRVDEIVSEVEEIKDGLTEEECQEYINEKEKLDTPKIKKDAKSKGDDVDPETKEKLKKLVALWDEKSKLDKAIKLERKALEEKTIETIQNLTDIEVYDFLCLKWIVPVNNQIMSYVDTVIDELIKAVKALAQKYATSYSDLNAQLVEAQSELAGLISDLTGDEYAICGLNEFKNSLKG